MRGNIAITSLNPCVLKKLPIAILALLLVQISLAQKKPCNLSWVEKTNDTKPESCLDCLEQLIHSFRAAGKSDSLYYAYMLSASTFQKLGQIDSSYAYARKIINELQYGTHPRIEGEAHNMLGQIVFYRGQLDSSEIYYQNSYDLFALINDSAEMAGMLNNLSILAAEKSEHERELELLIEVLGIEESLGHKRGMARSLINLAQCYISLDDPENARKTALRSVDIANELELDQYLAYAYNSIGDSYMIEDDPESAITYFKKALFITERVVKDPYLLGGVQKNVGDAFMQIKAYDSAAFYYKAAMQLQVKMQDVNHSNRTRVNYANALLAQGEYTEAKKQLDTAAKHILPLRLPSLTDILYIAYSKVYDSLGQEQKALNYLNKHVLLNDSTTKARYEKDLSELKTRFGVVQTEKQNELLTQKNELQEAVIDRKNLVIAISVMGVLLFLAVALLLYRSRKIEVQARETIEKQAKELQNSLDEIEKLLETKNQIFSIIAHDLRGPLGAIRQLLELLEEDRTDSAELITMARQTSQSSFQLLETLLVWANQNRGKLNYKQEAVDLKKSVDDTLKLLQAGLQNKGIEIKTHVEPELLVIGDGNMVSTTIRNIVGNAIKFTPKSGSIQLNARRENGHVRVDIKDSGVGMKKEDIQKVLDPNRYFSLAGTEREKGTGLGMKICQSFLTENGGTLEIESELGQGTLVSFTLPKA